MEAQVKGARPKQKNNTRKATAADTERKPSSGPSDAARRVIVSAATKRVIARFAKGPSDTGGFKYPRRRVSSSETLDLEPVVSLTEVMLTKEPATLEIIAVAVPLTEPVLASLEPVSGTLDQKHINDEETPATLFQEVVPVAENVPLEEMSKKVEEEPESTQEIVESPEPEIVKETNQEAEVIKKVEFELPDDTVGPGDSRSSESESSSDEEESEVEETVTPTPVTAPAKIVKQATNTTKPTMIMRKPVSPVYRKVVSAPSAVTTTPTHRSSWSKFLPLVIEIKATIPYPMHLLGVFLLLVTGLLLRLLYQFGADLGGEMEVQGQLIRLAKLAFLFVVVAVCVNFVEDNKELEHKEPLPAQPRLRPSKMSKNKKKMMLKV